MNDFKEIAQKTFINKKEAGKQKNQKRKNIGYGYHVQKDQEVYENKYY